MPYVREGDHTVYHKPQLFMTVGVAFPGTRYERGPVEVFHTYRDPSDPAPNINWFSISDFEPERGGSAFGFDVRKLPNPMGINDQTREGQRALIEAAIRDHEPQVFVSAIDERSAFEALGADLLRKRNIAVPPKSTAPASTREAIRVFRGDNYFLSNYSSSRIEIDGIVYPSGEHAFVALKTLDIEMREAIAALPTPGEARAVGRSKATIEVNGAERTLELRPNWDEIKYDLIKNMVRMKFEQNPDLAEKLLATGNAELFEGTSCKVTGHVDEIWGINLNTGKGRNLLGKIHAENRSEMALERGIDLNAVGIRKQPEQQQKISTESNWPIMSPEELLEYEKSHFITFSGSRETGEDVDKHGKPIIRNPRAMGRIGILAAIVAETNRDANQTLIKMRSGAAKGPDILSENVFRAISGGQSLEISRPTPDGNEAWKWKLKDGYYFMDGKLRDFCRDFIKPLVNNWDGKSRFVQDLIARDVSQQVGKSGETPSELHIYAAPLDRNGNVTGGTQYGVKTNANMEKLGLTPPPAFNLEYDENWEAARDATIAYVNGIRREHALPELNEHGYPKGQHIEEQDEVQRSARRLATVMRAHVEGLKLQPQVLKIELEPVIMRPFARDGHVVVLHDGAGKFAFVDERKALIFKEDNNRAKEIEITKHPLTLYRLSDGNVTVQRQRVQVASNSR